MLKYQGASLSTPLPLELVGNMDETPMYFDMIPGSTVESKGVKEVRVRSTEAEKRHVMMLLAALLR